jgi:hypothetical protein
MINISFFLEMANKLGRGFKKFDEFTIISNRFRINIKQFVEVSIDFLLQGLNRIISF